MTLKRKITLILLVSLLGVIFAASAVVTYAYFSKKEIYDGYLSGQVELLFDRLNDTGVAAYDPVLKAEFGDTATASKDADWGTKEYPFVISNVRHLYNLSELQRLGYFDKKFISKNTTTDFTNIPYFLVCTPDYTPALIDGTNFRGITAIGTDKYPFIGSVKGVTNTTALLTGENTVNGKTCDTSTISKVKVTGNPANPDVGLFGVIGYLGTEVEPTEQNPTPTFTGQISTVSNIVISDIQLTVDSSAWDAVTAFLEDIMINAANGHEYSFSELYRDPAKPDTVPTADYNKVPHENHHIGILAGHASYAKIEYISVYYSSDNVVAINLKDTTDVSGKKANYFSSTGILGYINNINPKVTFDENGNAIITAGSGDSTSELSYGSVGGGGTSSGNKAGYVLAGEMYNKYHFTKDATGTSHEDTSGTILLKDALDKDGNALCQEWIRDRILWGTQNTGRYYFYDGVFTFALSDQADEIEPTWDIVTDDQGNPVLDENGKLTYDIPDFAIGDLNDDTKWQMNTAKGNKAVVAYIKKVTNDTDFQTAVANNKQIFIMQQGTESLFLMSLYEQSKAGSGDFETKYTTPGTKQYFASQAIVNGLIQSYKGGSLGMPDGMTAYADTNALIAALQNENIDQRLRVINVGNESTSVTLDDLKAKYQINPQVVPNKYKFFAGNTPVTVNDGGTIHQYYDYANCDPYGKIDKNGGYIYYTEIRSDTTTIDYEYYWQSMDGSSTHIGTGMDKTTSSWRDYNKPEDVFTAIDNTNWEGEPIYTCTIGSKTYTGAVVNKSEGKFYSTGNTAYANGATLTKEAIGTGNIYYLYNDKRTETETNKEYYLCSDPTGAGTKYVLEKDASNNTILKDPSGNSYAQNGTSPSGKPKYKIGDNNYVLLDRYPTFTFSASDKDNNTNFLRMVEAKFSATILSFNVSFGTHHALWNGTDDAANTNSTFNHNYLGNITPTVTNNTEATLRFNSDGTCYIQYAIGNTGLYVNANLTANPNVFNTATSSSIETTKLCIYTVEGTQNINYGRITYDPIDDKSSETDCYTFSAGTHVLKATSTHTKNGNGNIDTTTTSYEAMPLKTDGDIKGLDWKNGLGATLSQADLLKKFKMTKGITFGASFNLFNGTLGSSGIITAPVGTDGVEANIPMACVAFKINKPVEAAKIRVIVSVAVSEYHPNEKDGDTLLYELGTYTRYFNLWKMEAAGESILQIFNATGSNLLDRFEVPRSHPYEPGTSAADAQHITVNYNGNPYRCYLNGDRILVAYEFTVNTTPSGTGTGVYCLGMSGIDANGDVVANVPMEIVYFSADGVASSGRDGASGSQIGTIDFVYDYNNTIVTVKDSSSTDENGKEDYNTYYPSYCLLYFNNSQETSSSTEQNPAFVSINNEVVKVRRYVDTTADSDKNHNDTQSLSTMTFSVEGDKYVLIVQYSRVADNVREDGVALEEPPAGGG